MPNLSALQRQQHVELLMLRLQAVAAALETVQSDLGVLDGKLDNFGGQLVALQADVTALDGKVETVDAKVSALS